MDLLSKAMELAENGIPVIALKAGEKTPITKNGVKDATTDLRRIEWWWEMYPGANIGIPMGSISGLIGLDIDYKDGCRGDFLRSIPRTVVTKTANGGNHAFFKYNPKIKNNLRVEPGVTVRSDGYYFVVPPSRLGDGKEYEFINGDFIKGGVEELPNWIEKKSEDEERNSKKPFQLPKEIMDGEGREENLFKFAAALRSKGLDGNEILTALEIANDRCVPPKPSGDLIRISKSVCRYESGASITPHQQELSFIDTTEKGNPKGTMANLRALLDHLEIIVRYNVISKEEEIIIPNAKFTIDNRAVATLAHIISESNRVSLPTRNLCDFLSHLADQNLYNPVTTWIESIPWDGQSRLEDIYDTVTSPSPLKKTLMKKWFLSCVAAAYEPNGVAAGGVLVFRGNQFIGKTKWFKNLAPESLNVLKDGAILHPDNKDSVFQVVTKWLVELGELDATFRKSDIAQLKAFLTKDQDVIRRAYAKKESHYARRTVFFASVNEKCFLNDPTGNRRFWTIECDHIAWEHGIDMQQLWAEIAVLYKTGHGWHLSKEENEELSASNEGFQQADPIEEEVRNNFAWSDKIFMRDWLTATQVCQKIGIEHPNNLQAKRVGAALRKFIAEKPKTIDGLTRFPVPPYHKPVI